MWIEIAFPSACILLLTSLPAVLLPGWQILKTGNRYVKDVEDAPIKKFYQRDILLTGNPYKPNGIETLPDAPKRNYAGDANVEYQDKKL